MSLFYPGLQQVLDADGNPIEGAKWRFYLSGTSTPIAVYNDVGLQSSAGDFIVSNGSGRFDPVYVDDANLVRARLEDSSGVYIDPFDIDPVNGGSSVGITPVYMFGAVGDGITDDTAALQSALNSASVIALEKNKTYLITSGLSHVTGAGFVCVDGRATIKAKTGTGGFNIKDTGGPHKSLDRNFLICDGTDDLTLRNIDFTTDQNTEVVLHGIRIAGGMGTEGYEMSGLGFDRFFAGVMVVIGSAGAGLKRDVGILYATNSGCTQGDAYWSGSLFPQTTVVEIDNDIISSTPSSPGNIKIDQIVDVTHSGSALTDFGMQTDGVNIVCHGANSTSGWTIDIGLVDRVGEPIDIQGFFNTIRIGVARNIYNDVLKFVHGAQYNDCEIGTVETCGRSVVSLFGSPTPPAITSPADRDTAYNTIRVGSVKGVGTYGIGLTEESAAVVFGNQTSTYKPKNNTVTIQSVVGDGSNMDYVVKDGSSNLNLNNIVFVHYATGWAVASTLCPPTNCRVVYLPVCNSEMVLSADQTLSTSTNTKIAFNTIVNDYESICDTTNNCFEVKWPGVYRVQAQARLNGWAATNVNISIVQDTTPRSYSLGEVRTTGLDLTISVTKDIVILENDVGTNKAKIFAYIQKSSGTSNDISNSSVRTFFSISRLQ